MPKSGFAFFRSRAVKTASSWEQIIINRAHLEGHEAIKIPEGRKAVGRGRWIPVKSPFDLIIAATKNDCFCDAKTYDEPYMKASKVTPHQLRELVRLEKKGRVAGYLVWFRGLDRIVFFHAHQLAELRPESSLRPDDGRQLGTLQTFSLNPLFDNDIDVT